MITPNRSFFLLLLILFNFTSGFAQVGIGTSNPDQTSALDVESTSGGVLIPRMTTSQRDAIFHPATGLLVYDTTRKCLSQQVGTPETPDWMCIRTETASRFFYLPSININTQSEANNLSIDLYEEYKSQFSEPLVSSNPGSSIPYFKKDELEYHVTAYDETVLDIHDISDEGIMRYDVKGRATACSFINVVLVVK